MDLEKKIINIVNRVNRGCKPSKPLIHLSMHPSFMDFPCQGDMLEFLLEQFLERISACSYPMQHMNISIRRIKEMEDIEKFFLIFPKGWIKVSISCIAPLGMELAARKVLENMDFYCFEWIGVEGSNAQLGDYRRGTSENPALILYVRDRGARRQCDFLIPLMQSLPAMAYARKQEAEAVQ